MPVAPENIATFGGDIDGVISFIGWIVLVWLVVAEVVLFYFLIRYRKKDGVRAAWMPGTTLRSNAWVLIPAALVTICDFVIEADSTPVWDEVKIELPEPDVLVRITARQFAWTYTYAGPDGALDTEDDFDSVTELHVPKDKVVRFQLESVDVLHSFWVVALRLKQDAVPGRSIPGWFQATQEGRYEIACAELCGGAHTAMRAEMVVHAPEAFDKWAKRQAELQALERRPAEG